jgi:hypothetical protein
LREIEELAPVMFADAEHIEPGLIGQRDCSIQERKVAISSRKSDMHVSQPGLLGVMTLLVLPFCSR